LKVAHGVGAQGLERSLSHRMGGARSQTHVRYVTIDSI
jgi:hypothetical protein